MKEKETRYEVEQGVAQVAPDATIENFDYVFNKKTRKSTARVTIRLQDGKTAEIRNTWG